MNIPQKTLDEILRKVDILEYISKDTTLKRKGDRFWGCCPIHKEKTPSFSVVPEKGFFYCFGCNSGGNLYKYIMETDHVGFLEAVEIAAEKAGVTIERKGGESKETRLYKEALTELYNRVAGSFSWILENKAEAEIAREYLENRGIKSETIKEFQLGYAPSDPKWLYNFLLKKHYTGDFLEKSGLFSRRHKGFPLFRDRLIFPIFNISGKPVAFSGRVLKGDGPKYINSPETDIYHKGSLLFGVGKTLPAIKERREFILCEGNLDLLALYQSGFPHCAAPLGTAFTGDQLKILKRYCNRGTLIFDSDKAGRKASMKAAILCEKENVKLKAVILPEGKDPADILVQDGAESLKKRLENPVNVFEYLLKFTADDINVEEPEGKEALLKELMPYLESLNSEIIRKEYLDKIAEFLILDKNTVVTDYRGKAQRRSGDGPKEQNPVINLSDELFLVFLCVLNRDLSPILNTVDFSEWNDDFAVSLARKMMERGVQENDIPAAELSEHPGWPEFCQNRQDDPVFRLNVESQAEDLLKKIHRKGLLKKREHISLLIQREDSQKNERALYELMMEKKRLDEEIEQLKV